MTSFPPPTNAAPLSYPQFKEAIAVADGMVRDHEAYILYWIASQLPQNALALEIGSWKGKSATAICWGLKFVNGHLNAVDNFAGIEGQPGWESGETVKQGFLANVAKAGVADVCTLHDMSSQDCANYWKQDVDFLFIDGCHLYDAARFDIFAFTKFVKPGGWIAYHDVRMRESVIRAILEYIEQDPSWAMEAFAWDNNLLALKRASSPQTAKPRWYLKLILNLTPCTCVGIPPSSQPFAKFRTKLMQSLSRFLFRKLSVVLSKA